MKRFLALILCLCLCLSMAPVSSAARSVAFQETLAQDLKELGLFRGVSETNFDLGRAPTRTEALVMLIRVLGKEEQALSGTYSHPFTDVAAWADPYVGYAYENGLTKGVSDDRFGTGNATCEQYLTFVLRALGYDDAAGDFSWSDPYELALSTGVCPGIVNHSEFWRADVVLISYAALPVYLKNSTQTLAGKLIASGVFTREKYDSVYDANAIAAYSTPRKLSAEEIYAQCSPAVFYIEVYDASGKAFASGSGFFLTSDGVAVTNYHVIDGACTAKATVSDTGAVYDITGVWDCSKESDWAVIQVDGSGFSSLSIGDVASIAGGQTVYAIGSPLGLQNSITQGVISNTARQESGVSYIQTSAAISHGSSGGALIDEYGHVIGITSASYVEGQNLNLALPISVVDGYGKTSLTTLAQLNNAAAPSTPSAPAAADGTTYGLLKAWIAANANDLFLDQYAAYRVVETDPSGYATDLVLFYDTENACLSMNYTFYFSSGAKASCWLDLSASGTTHTTYYYYYNSIYDQTAAAKGAAYVDAPTFSGDTPVRFQQYEGSAYDKDYHQKTNAMMVELCLYDLQIILTENAAYFSGADITAFGFPAFKT